MKVECIQRVTLDIVKDYDLWMQIKKDNKWELVGYNYKDKTAIYERVISMGHNRNSVIVDKDVEIKFEDEYVIEWKK